MTSSKKSEVIAFGGSTFVKLKKTKFLPFLSKGKDHASSLNRILLYIIYIMLMIVHLSIGPFLSMEVLCGFSKMIENIGIIGDQAGQLGENGEYLMGRMRVV
jgi:hypothetical protein